MKKIESLKGVPGMLRPFKEYVKSLYLKKDDQILFYGCPGTCTPFVELLGYAIRDLKYEIVFVPYLEEDKAIRLEDIENIGFQASSKPGKIGPELIVIMGGLAMPNVPVSAEGVAKITSGHNCKIAGVCFMNMFVKEGWTDLIDFEFLIDADINPVDIWKKTG